MRSAKHLLPDGSKEPVAVKIISKHLLKGQEETVMREIEMVQSLDHPHIVKLIEWFESKDKVGFIRSRPVLPRVRGSEWWRAL